MNRASSFWICSPFFRLALIFFKIDGTISESAPRLTAADGRPGLVVTVLLSGIL